MLNTNSTAAALVASLMLLITAGSNQAVLAAEPENVPGQERIIREVRHELVMLPYYDVFDHLAFEVGPAGRVTLLGSVTRPTLKSSAENVIKKIEGVESIDNRIDVLPVSPNDDRLRRAVFRAIYGQPGLDRYGFQSVPSIHIVVKNGNVSLEGAVNTEADRNLAGIKAKGVSGVFSVTNNLKLAS